MVVEKPGCGSRVDNCLWRLTLDMRLRNLDICGLTMMLSILTAPGRRCLSARTGFGLSAPLLGFGDGRHIFMVGHSQFSFGLC
jgi:hypothetical protein